jgi:maleylpyruvate isomerase
MPDDAATQRAKSAIASIRPLTDRLEELVHGLDNKATGAPCELPGWSRAHLITHLARNADAMLNLLTWARTGVEHQAYASNADRDADIEKGSQRVVTALREDLKAAAERLDDALAGFPESSWDAEVADRQGRTILAHQIPWMRVTELVVHTVDLGAGATFEETVGTIGAAGAEEVLNGVVATYDGREVPSVVIAVTLPDGSSRNWQLGDRDPVELSGSAAATIAWLTGRSDGACLDGKVPDLPNWR